MFSSRVSVWFLSMVVFCIGVNIGVVLMLSIVKLMVCLMVVLLFEMWKCSV